MNTTKIIVLTTKDDHLGYFPEWLVEENSDAFTFVIAFNPECIDIENDEDDIYERLRGMYFNYGGLTKYCYNTKTHLGGCVLRNGSSDPVGTIRNLMSLRESLIL